MKVNHLNEDTLQVMIYPEDLAARGTSLFDLLSHQDRMQAFFDDILAEVDVDNEFTDESVTFQVMQSPAGMELLITKNDAFNKHPEMVQAQRDQLMKFLQHELKDHDDLSATDEASETEETDEVTAALNDPLIGKQSYVIKFADFEDFLSAAKTMASGDVESSLYQYQNQYYLLVTFFAEGFTKELIEDQLGVLNEFGTVVPLNEFVLQEHGVVIMPEAAFELARHYFN